MLLNDGVVVDIVDNGVMDMKLEIAAAEAVLPPMIGRLGCGGAGCSGAASLAMTAAASGPKASTHDDVDDDAAAIVGAAVVAYVGVQAGVAAGAAGEDDIEKGYQAALMVASVGAASVVVRFAELLLPEQIFQTPSRTTTCCCPRCCHRQYLCCCGRWCRKQVVERWCGAVIEVIVVICSSRIITTKIEQIDGSGCQCVAVAPDTEDGGVAKDGDR